jgi:hypothetical protein
MFVKVVIFFWIIIFKGSYWKYNISVVQQIPQMALYNTQQILYMAMYNTQQIPNMAMYNTQQIP